MDIVLFACSNNEAILYFLFNICLFETFRGDPWFTQLLIEIDGCFLWKDCKKKLPSLTSVNSFVRRSVKYFLESTSLWWHQMGGSMLLVGAGLSAESNHKNRGVNSEIYDLSHMINFTRVYIGKSFANPQEESRNKTQLFQDSSKKSILHPKLFHIFGVAVTQKMWRRLYSSTRNFCIPVRNLKKQRKQYRPEKSELLE